MNKTTLSWAYHKLNVGSQNNQNSIWPKLLLLHFPWEKEYMRHKLCVLKLYGIQMNVLRREDNRKFYEEFIQLLPKIYHEEINRNSVFCTGINNFLYKLCSCLHIHEIKSPSERQYEKYKCLFLIMSLHVLEIKTASLTSSYPEDHLCSWKRPARRK